MEKGDDGHIFSISSQKFILTNKLEFMEYYEKEGFTTMKDATYHIFENGSKYITTINKEMNTINIHNKNGKVIKTINFSDAKDITYIKNIGNYFIISTIFFNSGDYIMTETGEILEERPKSIFYDNGIMKLYDNNNLILYNENFKIKLSENTKVYIYSDYFFAYNKDKMIATLYDKKGNEKTTYKNISNIYTLTDNYVLFITNTKQYFVIDEIGKQTFNFQLQTYNNKLYIPYNYLNISVGIIETNDAFYSLNGKKLFDK